MTTNMETLNHLVQDLANELYAAIPGRSSVANEINQGQAEGEKTTSKFGDSGVVLTTPALPVHGNKIPNPSVTESDPLTALAKQLYEQMFSGGLDPSLQSALAGLDVTPFNKQGGTLPQENAVVSGVENHSEHHKTTHSGLYFLSDPKIDNLGVKDAHFDVEVIRKDFPILHQKVNGKPLIWLDNAATTQKPQAVIDAISRFYERDNSNIHRAAHTLAARATDAYEAARESVQRFLGASLASEIVFARGTTEAINLVANTWGAKYIRQGDEIIVSQLEHHANIVPWQMLAQKTGAVIKVIPVNNAGEVILEEYTRLLGPRTRLVSVTQVSNALGTILPIKEITTLAHRHNARVLIDGAQGIPHLPVNVQEIDCDFYVFSGHKLFAPTGIGALYAKQEILEDIPPWQGGGSMIRHVTFEETVYSDPPAKFEAGTPNIADAVGLKAAIDYLNRVGLRNIEEYEHKLTCYAAKRLTEVSGIRLIGTTPHKVGVFSFLLDGFEPEAVGKRLDQDGIAVRAGHHCAQPTLQRYGVTATVRPSLAFYNTCQEIDTLVEVLKTLRYR
jgi:cysteine desulfurase / selenocysteine lyase